MIVLEVIFEGKGAFMNKLNDQAYDYILDLIKSGKLNYQTIYSETQLSKEIGISRTPLRDAIHRLAQEGYIDILPSRGFQLHSLTRQDILETFQVRSALEGYCTLQITKHYQSQKSKMLFKELEFYTEKMYEIMMSTRSIQDFYEYDFQFHLKIIYFADNQQFTSLFETFMHKMRRLAYHSLQHEGRMEDTYNEHVAILTAMESGDVAKIYDITLKHMDTPLFINLKDI